MHSRTLTSSRSARKLLRCMQQVWPREGLAGNTAQRVRAFTQAQEDPAFTTSEVPEAAPEAQHAGFERISELTRAQMQARGIDALFPMQQEVLNHLFDGLDVFVRARTGTGKTLAYVLPIGESLLHERSEKKVPQALVLAPTRELAKQVEREFAYTYPSLSVLCAYGGTPVSQQIRKLSSGVDIVVGTPGRLIDLRERGELNLSAVDTVIVDEGDEMLSAGFQEDTDKLLSACPTKRQTALFSATMPPWVKELLRKRLKQPRIIDQVGEGSQKQRLAHGIETLAIAVPNESKVQVAADVVLVHSKKKAIVFVERKAACDTIAAQMSKRVAPEALHGDMSQSVREKVLSRFRDGSCNVLVATDVAARGLDVSDVDCVVHIDLPKDAESFTHRSGRTARAGSSGKSIGLVHPRDRHLAVDIGKKTGATMKFIAPPTAEEVATAAARNADRALASVPADVLPSFMSRAQSIIETADDPAEVLARSLAALSGCSELPPTRGLLTGAENMVAVAVERDEHAERGPALDSKGSVVSQICKAIDIDSSAIGRIEMLANGVGAVVELPPQEAEKLKQLGSKGIVHFHQIEVLPELADMRKSTSGEKNRMKEPKGGRPLFRDGQHRGRTNNKVNGADAMPKRMKRSQM